MRIVRRISLPGQLLPVRLAEDINSDKSDLIIFQIGIFIIASLFDIHCRDDIPVDKHCARYCAVCEVSI